MKIILLVYYAMAYAGTKNNMIRRSIPGIVLRESNKDGVNLFMSLYTGKQIHRYDWMELQIDDEVVKRVEEIAKN